MKNEGPLKRIRHVARQGRGVTAAYPPFKRQGEGSTPSGPTRPRVAQW